MTQQRFWWPANRCLNEAAGGRQGLEKVGVKQVWWQQAGGTLLTAIHEGALVARLDRSPSHQLPWLLLLSGCIEGPWRNVGDGLLSCDRRWLCVGGDERQPCFCAICRSCLLYI